MDSLSFISIELDILSSSHGASCLCGSWRQLPPPVHMGWRRAVAFLLTLFSSQCFHDQPLVIPLHCLCTICVEADFSLSPPPAHRLVLWRPSPKQWRVCNFSQSTLMHCLMFILHPSTALPYSPFFHILQYHPTVPLQQYFAWWT